MPTMHSVPSSKKLIFISILQNHATYKLSTILCWQCLYRTRIVKVIHERVVMSLILRTCFKRSYFGVFIAYKEVECCVQMRYINLMHSIFLCKSYLMIICNMDEPFLIEIELNSSIDAFINHFKFTLYSHNS
jgi:hypothetical protein